MYVPWRDQTRIIEGYASGEEAYNSKLPSIPNDFSEDLHKAITEIQGYNETVFNGYIAQIVAPNVEAFDNDLSQPVINDPFFAAFDDFQLNPDSPISEKDNIIKSIVAGEAEAIESLCLDSKRMSDFSFKQLVNSFNHEKKTAYDFVHNHYIEYFNSEYPEEIPSFQLFISGPGGAGKSYLISAIQEPIQRLTLLPCSCIVTAPTGVAAFNM